MDLRDSLCIQLEQAKQAEPAAEPDFSLAAYPIAEYHLKLEMNEIVQFMKIAERFGVYRWRLWCKNEGPVIAIPLTKLSEFIHSLPGSFSRHFEGSSQLHEYHERIVNELLNSVTILCTRNAAEIAELRAGFLAAGSAIHLRQLVSPFSQIPSANAVRQKHYRTKQRFMNQLPLLKEKKTKWDALEDGAAKVVALKKCNISAEEITRDLVSLDSIKEECVKKYGGGKQAFYALQYLEEVSQELDALISCYFVEVQEKN